MSALQPPFSTFDARRSPCLETMRWNHILPSQVSDLPYHMHTSSSQSLPWQALPKHHTHFLDRVFRDRPTSTAVKLKIPHLNVPRSRVLLT